MSAERAALEALIESVADGNPIDWQGIEAAVRDDGARRRVRDLRLVAEVAALHRSHVDPEDFERPSGSRSEPEDPERWGHLIIREKIGEGAFGAVYRAHDSWLDRDVALKLLKPSIAGDVPTPRLLREAQSLARVRHPNVVLVHGADVHDDRVGLWMELLQGRTLEQVQTAQGTFGAAEAAVIGQELCRAIGAVHSVGLVHRDIKATNVMREPGGRLVLMDFGTGYRLDTNDARVELVGTPIYLAPEVLAGGSVTPRSDIYSLGVLLYHLVTGKYPVAATSLDELRAAHARGEIHHLSDARPDLPETFVRVIDRALSNDPAQRYASTGEMQAALAHVAAPEAEPRPSPAPKRWPQLLTGLLAVVAVLAVAVAIWRGRVAPAPLNLQPGQLALLAIMPFQNASTDPAEAYLASAVPMELTARLGQVGALRVVPWTFMKRFGSGGQGLLEEVTSRTGADAVVEGSVQRVPAREGSPGAVQVQVQIFQAGTGRLLWAASLERDLGDFFELQAQIAKEVAARLQIVPASRDQTLVSRSRQVPREAMEDYLNARQLLEVQMNVAGAASLFRRATERAANFAEAYVGLAWCSALESAYVGSTPADTALLRSLESSNRALEIDPEMPEAWAVRGFARFALEANWPAAEADLQAGRSNWDPHRRKCSRRIRTTLSDRGRHAEAIETARRPRSRAPFSVTASRQVAWAYYMARQHDRAIAAVTRTLADRTWVCPAPDGSRADPCCLPASSGGRQGTRSDRPRLRAHAGRRLCDGRSSQRRHPVAQADRVPDLRSRRAAHTRSPRSMPHSAIQARAIEWLEKAADPQGCGDDGSRGRSPARFGSQRSSVEVAL